jgi:hypothetical protein
VVTSASDDYLSFIGTPPSNFGYRQGTVIAWDNDTGANLIHVAGSDLPNLPIITQADVYNIRIGDTVAVIKFNDSYAVLGKIKSIGQGTLWMPVPLYPQFNPIGAAGTTGYWAVDVGILASWEGRIYVTHQAFIQIDGVWGESSGANTVTYELQLGGTAVGSWTTTGLDVGRKGPFSITAFRDQQFLKVEVKITSSVGSGTVALQVLGCFLR